MPKRKTKSKYEYETFDDWFWELEGFGLRGERFYGDVERQATPQESAKSSIKWLTAAFECGRMKATKVKSK